MEREGVTHMTSAFLPEDIDVQHNIRRKSGLHGSVGVRRGLSSTVDAANLRQERHAYV